jgi:hypothetical protein
MRKLREFLALVKIWKREVEPPAKSAQTVQEREIEYIESIGDVAAKRAREITLIKADQAEEK